MKSFSHKAMTSSHMKSVIMVLALLAIITPIRAQVAVAPTPVPKFRSFTPTGAPNASGCVYTFISGTSSQLATYTDSTGVTPNQNPTILDINGEAQIWIQALTYRFQVWTYGSGAVGANCGNGTQLYQIDGISEKGLLALQSLGVVLNPSGRANQTIAGPITADQFTGPATQLTVPFTLNTATNKPTVTPTNPASPGQNLVIPDPLTPTAHFLLDSGSANTLDCTAGIITCKRTASFYFGGASCNGTTASLGFDAFSTNGPLAFCITGTNTQKGVMGLPAAYTHLQQNSGTNSATTTVTTTYPNTTQAGSMLVLSVAFNGTTTITGCTDTTNAYSQAKHVAVGALSLDVWVFHNAASKTAGTTLTCTFAGAASSALKWHEYLVPNVTSTDQSASGTGTGTTVATGTTPATTQATELVFSAAGDLAAPTLVPVSNGYADHTVTNNSTVVQVDDAGLIQQSISAQASNFMLGSSQTWAAAIVTFKATNGATATAQKTIVLPTFFNPAQAINAFIKWSNPLLAIGNSAVGLGAQLACSVDGNTDDPVFNTATTSFPLPSQTAVNSLTNTSLTSLNATGCAAGNTMHLQVSRLRYSLGDIYEGFVNVYGVSLTVGVTQ